MANLVARVGSLISKDSLVDLAAWEILEVKMLVLDNLEIGVRDNRWAEDRCKVGLEVLVRTLEEEEVILVVVILIRTLEEIILVVEVFNSNKDLTCLSSNKIKASANLQVT